ncbi:ADP-ribose pyrophosphatase YjhB (NUDIX family) [Williamsia limnetica]|uniref:ADP-ribose pyrophosphatase YjhB (NUDIX family) n=1 Tax=Williamsia limnetica TaxID=882452 RepID=A0A318RDK1_WILLI|nr:ADP-ribose pyrophosphatase YjhB (NUDIX family) [Williamsia limnetica]
MAADSCGSRAEQAPYSGVVSIKRVSSTDIYANPWLSLREDEIVRADGSPGIYSVIDKPAGVIVIPRDDGRLYLVEQFRYAVGARRWEFPAGTAPDRQSLPPQELAVRELAEETGLRAEALIQIGSVDVAPGFSSQRQAVFLAERLSPGPPAREHEEQDMDARWWPVADVWAAVASGQICDAQTLAALTLLSAFDSTLR